MALEIVNFTEARKHLAEVMERVSEDRSPIIVTRQNAEPTVLISLAEYNRMTETMYLMGNPTNANRLMTSISSINMGHGKLVKLDEQ